jgi:hypothetical protein
MFIKETFWILEICFTYKFLIPDINRKQNIIFFGFLKYWSSSHDFNKLVIKAKMHAKILFFFEVFFVVWKYDVIFSLRDLAVHMKTKTFFEKKKFWRKPCILIPDLYLYGIKIQTNIKENSVTKYMGKSQIFPKIYFFENFWNWAKPGIQKNLGRIPLLHEQWA